jgi:iron(III) transport system substrate-binding protein
MGMAALAASPVPAQTSAAGNLAEVPGPGLAPEEWNARFKEWEQKSYAAAQQEGRVVWYSVDPKPTEDAIAAAWGKRYPGVQLDIQSGRGGALQGRIITEQDGNQVQGDLFIVATSSLRSLARRERIDHFIPPNATRPGVKWLIDPLLDLQAFNGKPFPVVVAMTPQGMLYNTQRVAPDEVPSSWLDLLDPRWKGRLILHDPRYPGYGNRHFFAMRQMHGEEYWKKLLAQNPPVDREYNLIAQSVAAGEYDLAVGMSPREYAMVEAAPVKLRFAKEGTPLTVAGAVIIKGAPHPNAARLFVNFYMSKEVQDIIGSDGARTPNLVGAKLRYDVQELSGHKLLVTSVEEEVDGFTKARKEVEAYIGR